MSESNKMGNLMTLLRGTKSVTDFECNAIYNYIFLSNIYCIAYTLIFTLLKLLKLCLQLLLLFCFMIA